jgi:hypothetical protein
MLGNGSNLWVDGFDTSAWVGRQSDCSTVSFQSSIGQGSDLTVHVACCFGVRECLVCCCLLQACHILIFIHIDMRRSEFGKKREIERTEIDPAPPAAAEAPNRPNTASTMLAGLLSFSEVLTVEMILLCECSVNPLER